MNYAVIFRYSFDSEVSVYLFETDVQAVTFLKDTYQEELRIDTQENGWDTRGTYDEENHYAIITTHFADHTDTTEMFLGNIYN